MAGEAGPKFGSVFRRENCESIKIMTFSLSKQLGKFNGMVWEPNSGKHRKPPLRLRVVQGGEGGFRVGTGVINVKMNDLHESNSLPG